MLNSDSSFEESEHEYNENEVDIEEEEFDITEYRLYAQSRQLKSKEWMLARIVPNTIQPKTSINTSYSFTDKPNWGNNILSSTLVSYYNHVAALLVSISIFVSILICLKYLPIIRF